MDHLLLPLLRSVHDQDLDLVLKNHFDLRSVNHPAHEAESEGWMGYDLFFTVRSGRVVWQRLHLTGYFLESLPLLQGHLGTRGPG